MAVGAPGKGRREDPFHQVRWTWPAKSNHLSQELITYTSSAVVQRLHQDSFVWWICRIARGAWATRHGRRRHLDSWRWHPDERRLHPDGWWLHPTVDSCTLMSEGSNLMIYWVATKIALVHDHLDQHQEDQRQLWWGGERDEAGGITMFPCTSILLQTTVRGVVDPFAYGAYHLS
jgi:hypothetical protein